MIVPLRTLGHDGHQVPLLGLDLRSVGGISGSANALEDNITLLGHAHSTGQRFWNTSHLYHDSEDIVGEWMKQLEKRKDIFLATNFAAQRDAKTNEKQSGPIPNM